MQKRRPSWDGAVLIGGEQCVHTSSRPFLKAPVAAQFEVEPLLRNPEVITATPSAMLVNEHQLRELQEDV